MARQWSECENKFAALDKTTNLTVWSGGKTQPTEGDGSTTNPYKVYTPEQLRWCLENKKSCDLMNDIDLGGKNHPWTPITVTEAMSINGNHHTIYNLYVSGGTNQGFFGSVNNANFYMHDLTFRYSEVHATGIYSGTVIAWLGKGKLENVNVEDSLVKGANHTGGLLTGWSTGNIVFDGTNVNPTAGMQINHCHTERVYTYGTSCVANFIGPIWGGYVTNSYAVDGVSISTAGHSGGFVSCPGYTYVAVSYTHLMLKILYSKMV